MKESQAKLYLISDMGSNNQVENLFGEIGDYRLDVVSTNDITFDQKSPSIYIILITMEDSPVLEKLLKVKNIRKDRVVFLLTESSARSVIKLVRKGFSKIYEIPEDIKELKNFLLSELKGLDVNFRSKFRGLSGDEENLRLIFGFGRDSEKQIKKIKDTSRSKKINIILEGEFGLLKSNLAHSIHSVNLKKNDCFTEFILPYSDVGKYSLKIESEDATWYKDVDNESSLAKTLFPGTILLNNVHEMSLPVQKRLSTLLASLSGQNLHRIIATTEEDLFSLCKKGKFDERFYYFLNTAHFTLVPLRFRKDDIQNIFEHFILEHSNRFSKEITKIDNEILDFIYSYPWLGNIQELSNAVENAVTLSGSTTLKIDDFTNVIHKNTPKTGYKSLNSDVLPDQILLEINFNNTSLDELTTMYVKDVLSKMNNNKSRTAEILGITRPTLQKIIS